MKIDFLLYIGADTSDEPVFQYLRQKSALKKSQYFDSDCKVNLVVLGKKPSKADFFVEDTDSIAVLLNKMGMQTKRRKKNRSYSNLQQALLPVKTKGLATGASTNNVSVCLPYHLACFNTQVIHPLQ